MYWQGCTPSGGLKGEPIPSGGCPHSLACGYIPQISVSTFTPTSLLWVCVASPSVLSCSDITVGWHLGPTWVIPHHLSILRFVIQSSKAPSPKYSNICRLPGLGPTTKGRCLVPSALPLFNHVACGLPSLEGERYRLSWPTSKVVSDGFSYRKDVGREKNEGYKEEMEGLLEKWLAELVTGRPSESSHRLVREVGLSHV